MNIWKIGGAFFNNDDYSLPLVQLSLIHAQFEIIHPFEDGNGRLGRMLIPLFMYQKSILKRPVFYISEYLHDHDEEYRDRLLAITEEGDWMGWLTFFLKAIGEQAKSNNAKAQAMQNLYEEMKKTFREVARSHSQLALDTFFKNPIQTSTEFRKSTQIGNVPTSNKILKGLTEKEIITLLRPAAGRAPAIYMFDKLIKIAEGIE